MYLTRLNINTFDLAILIENPIDANARQHGLTAPALHQITFRKIIYGIGLLIDEPERFV
jgi:hypothetical protein